MDTNSRKKKESQILQVCFFKGKNTAYSYIHGLLHIYTTKMPQIADPHHLGKMLTEGQKTDRPKAQLTGPRDREPNQPVTRLLAI